MKTIVTHNGSFHADDVFAVATILLSHPEEDFQIVRTRDKSEIEKADIVLDVGGIYDSKTKRFDHHQEGGGGKRENGIPYASFGLVWKEYGDVVCGGDFFVAKQVEDGLVCPIDANDNGVRIYEEVYPISPFDISKYIREQNLTWKEEDELGIDTESKRKEKFERLVPFAKELIERMIKGYKDKNSAVEIVKGFYEKSEDKAIVIMDKYYPWHDALLPHEEPKFVVFPKTVAGDSEWVVKTISTSKESFDSRKPFPKSWAGKMDKDLQRESGVDDAVFCHNNLFLAVARSKDGAIALARLALNSKE